jgi:hypothetical protein
MSWEIPQSQENWDSLPGTVLVSKLQGSHPGNYFSGGQTRIAERLESSFDQLWPQFLHLKNRDNNSTFFRVLYGLNEMIYIKFLA